MEMPRKYCRVGLFFFIKYPDSIRNSGTQIIKKLRSCVIRYMDFPITGTP